MASLSLLPKCWNYRQLQCLLYFYVGSENLNTSLHVFIASTLSTEPSPWSYLFFICRMCAWVYTFGGQRSTSVFLYRSPAYVLRHGLLLNLDLTGWLVQFCVYLSVSILLPTPHLLLSTRITDTHFLFGYADTASIIKPPSYSLEFWKESKKKYS